MGCVRTITADKFPKQGAWWGHQVRVCFHFDTSKVLLGRVVRDDAEAPHVTIIQLEDGRHVLSTECQLQFSQPSREIAMTDIELLPLPEADGFMETFDTYGCPIGSEAAWGEKTVKETIRVCVAHATAAQDAEIEALRADRDSFKQQAEHNLSLAERLAEALREARDSGGYVRDVARAALRDHDQEVGNG